MKNWQTEFKKISKYSSDWCGCYEGDMDNIFDKQQQKVLDFIQQLLDNQKQQFLEMIGEDEDIDAVVPFQSGVDYGRNQLRKELRNKVNENL